MPCPHRYGYQPRPKKPVIRSVMIGESGLALLRYTGFQEKELYKGLETGASYVFGLLRPRGYVDVRDVKSFLQIVEDSQWVFEEA